MSNRIFCVGISLIMAGLLCSCSADASNVSKGLPVKTETKTTSVQDAGATTSQTEVTETTTTTGASTVVTKTTQESSAGTRISTTTGSRASTTTAGPTTTAYTPRPKNPPTLSETQKAKIKEDWISGYINPEPQHTADEVKIKYYGTYNGYIALTITDNYYGYPAEVVDENIDGIIFHNLTGFGICIWDNGNTISLRSAYGQGLLSSRDLQDIEYYYRNGK